MMYTILNNLQHSNLRIFALLIMLIRFVMPAQAQGCSQPSNLVSTVLASGTVALEWSATSGALSYAVQYRIGSTGAWTNGGTVTTTNQVLTGLAPETVYSWRVKANCSTFSSVALFNTGGAPGGNSACSQPSNQIADVTSPSTATLFWSAIEGALYYTVQYRLNNTGPWTNAGSVPDLSINILNLNLNATYGWRVKASCSVYSSVATFNTGTMGAGGNSACSQPSNTEAFALSNSSVELSWSSIQEAQNYTVQYRQGLDGDWITLPATTATSLTLSGLLEGTEYSWRVKASCSDFSSQAVFTTGTSGGGSGGNGGGSSSCSAPSNTNTIAVFPTSASVEWEPQGGALDYTVEYRLQLGSTYTLVGTFTGNTATITGLTPGTAYVWRVKANCSPYGSDNQFSTPQAMMNNGAASRVSVSANEVVLFPNPSRGGSIQMTGHKIDSRYNVLSLTGQTILEGNLVNAVETLNVSNLNNGIYLVRVIEAEGEMTTIRVVIGDN